MTANRTFITADRKDARTSFLGVAFDRLSLDTVLALEPELVLLEARPGDVSKALAPYLYWRTAGVIGSISALLREGAALAMDRGTERLSESLLDEVEVDADAEGQAARRKRPAPSAATADIRRGDITDRSGNILATTAYRDLLAAHPELMTDDDQRANYATTLAQILGLNAADASDLARGLDSEVP